MIFDEPTAVLTPQERDTLFVILRKLAAQGKTILFITHKLREVFALADSASVLRDGKLISTTATIDTNIETLSRAMVGREVVVPQKSPIKTQKKVILQVENLRFTSRSHSVLKPVSFQVHQGEILGIAGVAGNGQSELITALTGLHTANGSVRLHGCEINHLNIQQKRKAGIAYVAEDRTKTGLAEKANIEDNLVMGKQYTSLFSKQGWLRYAAIKRFSHDLIQRYQIKAKRTDETVANLSGGNQQKLMVAREFEQTSTLLIVEQPTRGVDIGAIEFIHQQLLQARAAGKAILLVSSELSEIQQLADRILVMFEGSDRSGPQRRRH